MTVAEIKEYINEVENKYLKAELIPIFTNANLEEIITNLRSMLDELEQPIEIDTEKYFETIDKLIDKEMAQQIKDQMKKELKKEIEKGVKVDDTTSNSDRHNRR